MVFVFCSVVLLFCSAARNGASFCTSFVACAGRARRSVDGGDGDVGQPKVVICQMIRYLLLQGGTSIKNRRFAGGGEVLLHLVPSF